MAKARSSSPAAVSRRAIPSVEKILQALRDTGLPRPMVVATVRHAVGALRESEKPVPAFDAVVAAIRADLERLARGRIQPVINGTGIVVHTNLGRSPLSPSAIATLTTIGANYNNLEFDLVTGERGGRAVYLEQALALLCEAEAATVANNCAAALVLILRHFTAAARKEVIISRGELVQIGGGFRIPEILEASGARLREVGATNKTSLQDYARAIGDGSALLLKVHRSNFFMGGFVDSPSTEELSALAKEKGLPFVEDLGSGAVVATEQFPGIEHEPTPAEVLRRGVDLVCFSGDKLLGGPQAGIIAGRAPLVAALKQEPFFRALRCDKLILSALQTIVEDYLSGEGGSAGPRPPTHQMLAVPVGELEARAKRIVAGLAGLPLKAAVGEGQAQVGGGTLPKSLLPSVTVNLQPAGLPVAELAARLRDARPPVIGYIGAGHFRLDLRTVFPAQDDTVIAAIRHAVAK
jgi:L-seryl-tRNA(Ser) seleniumtransferase